MTKADDGVGSVAEEAAKLFAALHRDGDQPGESRLGADCQWCPVCQLIHRVRQASPETVEHLTAAAAGLLGSVRGFLEAAAEAAADKSGTPDVPDTDSTGVSGKVDRIDVSEDPERWD